ncbi:MAG: RNA methyltransferase [Gammaproteobacteria bacterium]|nr:RNA methyltransferase [Gammaproteobacteria bacterium]
MKQASEFAAETPCALVQRTRIVLVEPSHSGNIGAAARAMKAMGMTELVLVNPRAFPSAEATARASGADDLLVNARVHGSLPEAIADCGVVVGTTARTRHLEWPVSGPREVARALFELPPSTQCALLFGREQAGLSNQELALCQRVIRIPTEDSFSSLNIAQAVQICAYELRMSALGASPLPAIDDEPLANGSELKEVLEHLLRVMEAVDFFNPAQPKLLPIRLSRLVNRSGLKRSEAQILRGFFTAIEKQRHG